MIRPLLPIAAIAMALTACNTTDPSQGGFFGGVGGLSSGNYERGTQARRDGLTTEQQRAQQLQDQHARTETERQQVSGEKAALQRQTATLNGDISRLRGRLSAAEASRGQNNAEVQRLRGEVDALDRQTQLTTADPTLGDAEKRRRIEELSRRKDLLQRAVDQAAGVKS